VAQFFDHYAQPSDYAVEVCEEDFLAAKNELVPSVSVEELGHYERVRKSFEGDGGDKNGTGTARAAIENGSGNGNGLNGGSGMAKGKGKGKAAEQPPTWTSDLKDMEAWQAAKIEELMRRGFEEGSLARNDPKPGRPGSGSASGASNGNPGTVNGKGKGKAPMGLDEGEEMAQRIQGMGLDSADSNGGVDEEGISSSTSKGKGKGKGKARAEDPEGEDGEGAVLDNGGFGNAAMDDELY